MTRYVGVLHVHSTLSDGRLTPSQVRQRAGEQGLDFVILTEHAERLTTDQLEDAFTVCGNLSNERLLVGLTLEYALEGRHVLVIGQPDLVRQVHRVGLPLDLEWIRAQGGLVIWAHPAASASCSLRWVAGAPYDGWEVWNGRTDGTTPSLPMVACLRRKRTEGRDLLAFGGCDLHKDLGGPLLPVTEVQARVLELGELLKALRTGAYRILGEPHDARFLSPHGECPAASFWVRVYAGARYAMLRAFGCLRAKLGISPVKVFGRFERPLRRLERKVMRKIRR